MNKVFKCSDSDETYSAIVVAADTDAARQLLNEHYGVPSEDEFADDFSIEEVSLEYETILLTDSW